MRPSPDPLACLQFPRDVFDEEGNGAMDAERFAKYFLVCKRCTVMKEKNAGAKAGDAMMEGSKILPVVVRKMPCGYEGERIRSCHHYQWIWCPGIPGNLKCGGSNRHDRCPKYLAKSTFWKHVSAMACASASLPFTSV